MEHLKERVSYLKGLAEGLNVSDATNEGKLLKNIINVLEEFADAMVDMDAVQEEMGDYVEEVDNDLAELEEDYYGEQEEDLDGEYYEIECPICNDTIVVEEDAFDNDEIICPSCKNPIEIEFDEKCDCCCECEDEK